jgi:hypothetical protein
VIGKEETLASVEEARIHEDAVESVSNDDAIGKEAALASGEEACDS